MFKVLIIDDEAIIAKGLQTKMDWKRLGCTVCGVAGDGLEGRRLLDELEPDIVISDIVMPGLTGLELADYIFSRHPSVITIILTAYDDFKYAQQAIRFGVKEYILKPIDKTEMLRAVSGAVKSLRERQSLESDVSRLHDMVTEVKPIITGTLLFNIALNGDSEIEALGRRLHYFDLNIGKVAAMVFELEPQPGTERSGLHGFALKNAIQSVFERHGCPCDVKETEGLFAVLAHFDGGLVNSVIQSRLREISDEIREQLSDTAELQVSGGAGRVVRSVGELHASYLEARKALDRRFFASAPGIFIPDNGAERTAPRAEYPDLARFIRSAGEGNAELAQKSLGEILGALHSAGSSRLARDVARDMARQLNSLAKAAGGGEQEWLSLDKPEDLHTLQSLKSFLEKAVEEVCRRLAEQSASAGGSKIVRRVEKMIRESYRDKGFSLHAAASGLEVSLSYLSRLFKKETGQNFMEYLTDVRIREAKKLLSGTDMKNNEIADRVGFYDVGYFSQVFRKKCRMTPSEYRQHAAAGQKIK